MIARLAPAALRRRILAGGAFALLDVRTRRQFAGGHILTASSAPLSRLPAAAARLLPCRRVAVALADGGDGLAQEAGRALAALGYGELAVLEGGVPAWRRAGYQLFQGFNVPSKAFGEVVERICATPSLAPAELRRRLAAGCDLALLDGRPFAEYRAFCIPGAVSCPNAELVCRVRDLVPNPATAIVVNCAGRTRSIVGAQTLRHAGVPNPVFSLRNGTMGWRWAGLALERGGARRHGPASPRALAWSRAAAARLAARCGVETIDAQGLAAWRRQAGCRTLHVFDVRQGEEYAAASLADAAAVEGTQLVQTADDHIAVRDARILLLDDDGVRARVTAAWLKQMGYRRAAVLAEDVRRLGCPRPLPPQEGGNADALAPFDEAGGEDAAGRAYIAWELQLPQQLARDGLLTFRPLA